MAKNDFVGIEVQGLAELQEKLAKLPRAAQDQVTDDLNVDAVNILKAYPSQKTVTRKAAYGVSFFTDKQRRRFFANLNEGNIDSPYRRTQGLRNAWKVEGEGARSFIVNDAPGAMFVVGDETQQSRHEKLVGWKSALDTLNSHMRSLLAKANAAVKKAIRKVGLE
jgi:hypothetical protein